MKKICFSLVLVFIFCSFQQKEITWVAIGDSITYLNEHPDEAGNRITKGYMTRIWEAMPNIHYINQGHNGWTAIRIATEIDKLGLTKADLYTVFLGTNDWWGGKPLGTMDDYKSNSGNTTVYGAFRTIIDKLHSLNNKAKIVLITPMQRVDFVYLNNFRNNAYGSYKDKNGQQLEQFADAVNAIGRAEKIPVVDLYHKSGMTHSNLVKYKRLKDPQSGTYQNFSYPQFIDIPFNPDTDEYPYPLDAMDMTYDGLHPSDKGYAVIANMLMKTFLKMGRDFTN